MNAQYELKAQQIVEKHLPNSKPWEYNTRDLIRDIAEAIEDESTKYDNGYEAGYERGLEVGLEEGEWLPSK